MGALIVNILVHMVVQIAFKERALNVQKIGIMILQKINVHQYKKNLSQLKQFINKMDKKILINCNFKKVVKLYYRINAFNVKMIGNSLQNKINVYLKNVMNIVIIVLLGSVINVNWAIL